MIRHRAQTAATMGVLLSAALLLGYVESLVPYDFAVPGIKLGLPNILTLIVLRKKGIAFALPFGLLRVLISNLLFGNVLSLFYAVAGCVFSVVVMWVAGRLRLFGAAGQSVLGALGHNIGQLAAAMVLLGTPGLLYYLPFLMVAGAFAGFLMGVIAGAVLEKGGRFLKI